MPSFSIGAQVPQEAKISNVCDVVRGYQNKNNLTDKQIVANIDAIVRYASKIVRKEIYYSNLLPAIKVELLKSNIADSIEKLKRRLMIKDVEMSQL